MADINGKLLIVSALECESKPIRKHYTLQRLPGDSPYRCYSDQYKQIFLVHSSVGALAAASATSWAIGKINAPQELFCLNIGIAGGQHPLGTLFGIDKITEHASGISHYPGLSHYHKLNTGSVVTHSKPSDQYEQDKLLDMEAAGFYVAASQFVPHAQISLLKIISDNDDESRSQISSKRVIECVEKNMAQITQHCSRLIKASSQLYSDVFDKTGLDLFFDQWHFTQYQRFDLHKKYQQWQCLIKTNLYEQCQHLQDAKAVLRFTEKKLQQAKVSWD